MDSLEKLFDTYSLNARVKPAFFIIFPIVLVVAVWFESSRTWGGGIVTFIISFGIISFAANQMSSKGNILQDKLFSKWGGAPTTIIMRHSDNRLDKYTKERYMQKLDAIIPNFKPISLDDERKDLENSDEMYRTAANYLREHTRDIKKYPLIFKENISYGFSRNIRAFKVLGILSATSALTASMYLTWYNYLKDINKAYEELIFSVPFINSGLLIILLATLFFWVFFVTEKWVEIRAFAYAKSLYASCEKI